ncbi:hypothetical protein AMC82_CH03923 [Rhizobium phaseoli]|uniref:hypothetical protein n=1 Tax=Rhizobium phaseoli TaxID=396 RepID=UPI0007EBE778|nr:hypothetical protein [Rhizobium phaseoli]ANL55081.1 hypothetical protein AMC86_CH03999 [Rhizobium phaseoli]ANL67511.1 hypothetical protein AMC84_CH03937 [Rhizobium phaseoli]ANL80324.1 hypothetical protein AMC82_CH03923 [Rhizobium phaseoli]
MINEGSKFPGKDHSDKGKWIGPWMPQWRDPGDKGPFTTLRQLYGDIQDASEALKAKRDALKKTGEFTPAGITGKLKQVVRAETIPTIRTAAAEQVRRFRKEVDSRRAAMKPFDHDPKDIVSEMRRQEVRAWLRTLKPDERTKAVRSASDPLIKEAALSVPVELTGLLPSTRDGLTRELIEARYGDEIAALNELDAAVSTVERAVDGARDDVRESLGMTPHDFNAEFRDVEDEIDRLAEIRASKPQPVDFDSVMSTVKALNIDEQEQLMEAIKLEQRREDTRAFYSEMARISGKSAAEMDRIAGKFGGKKSA